MTPERWKLWNFNILRMTKNLKELILVILLTSFFSSFSQAKKSDKSLLNVIKASQSITIDGIPNETPWQEADWLPLDQLWLGPEYTKEDFSGRYKLLWDEDGLYLLAEITDDILLDQNTNPLVNWWDDDCLEIFIDENNSGGNHQFNHSAFAYHVALDGNVVDMSTKKEGKLYNSHVTSKRQTQGNTSIWELKILIFDESYSDNGENRPITLEAGKEIGFALAYCDNDTSDNRENFIGSINNEGFRQNQGWIDATIFGTLILQN